MLTHHQTQSVTMLQPILTVAPSPRQGKRISIRPSQRRRSLCELNLTFLSPPLPPPLSPPPPPTGTNSTNAVGGSGGLSQSQGGSQCLSAPQQRKGTFTDDLHKLVDNWARDAMNLSQVEARNSFSRD